MRAWAWGIVAAAGFGLMAGTYQRRMAVDPSAPWGSAILAIGEGGDAPEGASALRTRVVLLPLSGTAEGFTRAMEGDDPEAARRFAALVAPKLIELPPGEFAALDPWLRSGRLPKPDADEILAGAEVGTAGDDLTVGGRRFRVVGALKPDVALFAPSYLVPAGAKPDGPGAESLEATLLRATDAKGGGAGLGERIVAAYPKDRFQLVGPRLRPDGESFFLYLSGQATFLLGGSGLLIALYRRLADRSTSTSILFAPALREITGRPGLIWGLHLAYFGLYVLGSLAAYALPEMNTYLTSIVSSELGSGGKGPLALAGQAYRSGSIPYAAVVTFMVNFPLGSLAAITLPSLIVPGSGVLVSLFRASTWGLLLGPTESLLARRMIPHTGTLLLEGEGYILATFFALLVPIYLFGRGPITDAPPPPTEEDLAFGDAPPPAAPAHEETPEPHASKGFLRRFLAALAVNVRGNVLVAIVLAVAAVYEAIEVIRMAGF